jgi:acetyl esterase/lipase
MKDQSGQPWAMKRVWITVLAAIAALAAFAVWSPAFLLNLVARGADVTVERDIAFGDGERLKLDIYKPAEASGPLPVVVFFYGGSWQRGDKASYRFVGSALARAGIVAVVPNYRLYPPVRYPDFLRDSALVVRWTKDNAGRFGGDAGKVFLAGHSAGAYNAVSLATDRRWLGGVKLDPRSDIAGVIGIAGPYDFLPLTDEYLKIIFGPEGERPKTQPINYVDGGEPPLLLMRPQNDRVVDPGNSSRLAQRVNEKGGNAAVVTYDRVGHLSILGAFSPLLSFLAPARNDLVAFVRAKSTGGAVER